MADLERYDKENKRTITMYVEDGMQHRHNSVPRDGIIPMHVHKNAFLHVHKYQGYLFICSYCIYCRVAAGK